MDVCLRLIFVLGLRREVDSDFSGVGFEFLGECGLCLCLQCIQLRYGGRCFLLFEVCLGWCQILVGTILC